MLLTGCMGCGSTTEAREKKGDIAQTMAQFKGIDDVEFLEIDGPLLGIGKLIAKEAKENLPTKNVKSICILDAESASDMVRQDIIDKMDRALSGYDLLMSAKDDGDDVTIYAKTDGDTIRELVVYVRNDVTVIALSGKISMEEIGKMID